MTAQPEKEYQAGSEENGKLCTICQTKIRTGEYLAKCRDCGLVYHRECWMENDGCAQYGCKSAPETVKADSIAEFQTNIWGEEKICPRCGRRIKSVALKCRFCGAMFDSRDFISRDQFSRRAYKGDEYGLARAIMIAILLLSVSGCLTPVGLFLALLLRFQGRIGRKLEFKRLPQELRVLNTIGIVVSCVIIFFMMVFILID